MSELSLYHCCVHDGDDEDDNGVRFHVRAENDQQALDYAAAENGRLEKPRPHIFLEDASGRVVLDGDCPAAVSPPAPGR